MFAKLLLFCLVSYAAAGHYAWKPNIQYTYRVQGRTLSGLNDQSPMMSGIFLKADFVIVPKTEDTLTAKIKNAQYSPVQMEFEEGWDAEVDTSKFQYQPLKLSEEPFEIQLQHGIVADIVVSKNLENWEANMIKGIVSQIQLNVNGKFSVDSPITTLPKRDSNFGIFKVMEKTVTGEFETSYVMKPEPSTVWPILKNEENDHKSENILITKYKNYSSHGILVGYHYGFAQLGDWEPNTESMGSFMNRTCVGNAVIFGSVDDYTIKSSNTSNVISFSPQFNNDKSGMIGSNIGIVYKSMEPGSPFSRPQNPTNVGIIYQYDNGFESNKIETAKEPQTVQEEESVYDRPAYLRLNSIRSKKSSELHLDETDLPLDQPPKFSTEPVFNGYKGKSIKYSDKIDIVRDVQKIANEIAEDYEHPDQMIKKSTVTKFSILVRLVRIMNKEEMTKAAQALYTEEYHGRKADSWKVYRDAVAQAGTGPALLTVEEFIKTGKIDGEEAAEVIATISDAARYPTPKYLKAFEKLVFETVEQRHEILNDTAVMSYADLLYKVCVREEISYQQYPFHTYGSFYTNQCLQIVEEYIKYLEGRLYNAIEKSDSHKILVYIRALGNVGHRDIYRAFEKYLQYGERHNSKYHEITEFQRFTMVSALNRFARLYPDVARDILVNIYFSSSEDYATRSIAVYLLSYTKPDADTLSAMAQYTEVDNNEYTNSAVKSTINRLAESGYEPAIQAQKLLTETEYGYQYPQNSFYEYVSEKMNAEYHNDIKTIGSLDSILPSSLSYYYKVSLGEARYTIAFQRTFISSIRELVNAFEQQTEEHNEQIQKKSSQLGSSEHSSHKVYDALSMNIEEREQLEGFLRFGMGEAERSFIFNNYTVENVTEFVKYWERQLKSGMRVSATKFLMKYETLLSAPTEMGIPYVFNNEVPTVFRVDGNVQAKALPEISNGDLLRYPENVEATVELRSIFSRSAYSAIRFYTPFDHQDYASGYDKKMQVYLPIKSHVKIDLKTNEATATVQAIQPESDVKVFQYHTIPYTVRRDLLNLRPSILEPHYIILTQQTPNVETTPFGHKSVGITFEMHRESDSGKWSYNEFLQRIERKGFAQCVYDIFFDNEILYSKTEFSYRGSESANREMKLRFRYMHYHTEGESGSNPSVDELVELSKEQKQRLETISKKSSADIKSAAVTACDIHADFVGRKEITWYAGGSYARSPVDKRSRVIAYIRKQSQDGEIKPFYFGLVQTAETPNTNGLDFNFAMKFDPTIHSKVHIIAGEEKNNLGKVDIDAKFRKTNERVEYLRNLPQAARCFTEMQEGNRIMPTCANMTARANLLDDAYIRVQHSGLGKMTKQVVQKAFDVMRPCRNNEFEFEHFGEQRDGTVELKLRFSPDLNTANYTADGVWATNLHHVCNNIPVSEWEQQIYVLHPVFRLDTRLESEAFNIDTYRPICVVDKNKAATFDGKEYDVKLTEGWTVMLHHLPQYANQSHTSDLKYRTKHQTVEHVVLVRKEANGKGVKMTLRTPTTEQKLVEVELRPTGQTSPRVKVYVDKQEVHYDEKHCKDFYHRAVRVYGLPNDEVKVEIDGDYYVITDGERVKLSTTSYQFNNATRGICGTHNFMDMEDFILPNGEIEYNSPEYFINAYTIGAQRRGPGSFTRKTHTKQFRALLTFPKVRDLTDRNGYRSEDDYSCTNYQTLHVSKGGQDCFTVRTYPVCKPGCKSQETKSKKISFICLTPSTTTSHWKQQAEKGHPLNFQNRAPNAEHDITIPTHCKH